MAEQKEKPEAWIIVHPSGKQVIIMHDEVESVLHADGIRTVDTGTVGMAYRALDVKPLYTK